MTRMDLLGLVVVLLSWQRSLALPNGAPSAACTSMYPQHPGPAGPVSAQSGLLVPFQIQVAEQDGGRGYKIRVVRNPNFSGSPNLLGFYLQVRDTNSDVALGEFVDLPPYAKLVDCHPNNANTVTHIKNDPKPMDAGLEFTWLPTNMPSNTRDIQVLGTFVQNLQTFWVKVPSQIFTVNDQASVLSTGSSNPVIGVGNAGTPVNVDGNVQPVDHQNNNNNDRKPGFGSSGNVQQPGFKVPGSGASSKFLAGLTSILAGLVIAL